jgi:hypothetical protein
MKRRLPGELRPPPAPVVQDAQHDVFTGADHFLIERLGLTVMSWQSHATVPPPGGGHSWRLPADLAAIEPNGSIALIRWFADRRVWQPQIGPHVIGETFASMSDALTWLRRARGTLAGKAKEFHRL